MRTEQLIQAMAADTTATRPTAAVLPWAVLSAAAIVAALALPLLGIRPDLGAALMQLPVLVKQAFPLLLAAGAIGATLRLARPGLPVGRWVAVLAAVPVVLGLAVVGELIALPKPDWMPALIGRTNSQCLLGITLMSIPLLAGTLWALRHGASTRPALSGAVAGLLSAGVAGAIYAVHCTEDSPLFYAVWYGLAIVAVTGLGAALGSRLLRW